MCGAQARKGRSAIGPNRPHALRSRQNAPAHAQALGRPGEALLGVLAVPAGKCPLPPPAQEPPPAPILCRLATAPQLALEVVSIVLSCAACLVFVMNALGFMFYQLIGVHPELFNRCIGMLLFRALQLSVILV